MEENLAAAAQRAKGDCLEGPSLAMVELAELLVQTVPWGSWAFFAKNGSDATELAVRIARAQTKKRVVLRAPASSVSPAAKAIDWNRKSTFEWESNRGSGAATEKSGPSVLISQSQATEECEMNLQEDLQLTREQI